jgi:hypothetical protein
LPDQPTSARIPCATTSARGTATSTADEGWLPQYPAESADRIRLVRDALELGFSLEELARRTCQDRRPLTRTLLRSQ